MKLYLSALLPLFIGCATLYSKGSATVPQDKGAVEIRRIEQELKWLEQVGVDAFVSHVSRICIDDPSLGRSAGTYSLASAEEERLVNAGIGQNHPRFKSVRARKVASAGQISAFIVNARSRLESRLVELRKDSGATHVRPNTERGD